MLLRTLFILGLSSIVLAQTDQPEYGGPSILSRGLSASVLARQQNVRLRPNIGVNGFCDDGLAGFTVGRDGKVPNQLACGVSAELGVYGYHLWRKSQLGLRYSGTYNHYARYKYYDGTDQILSLGYSRRLSKRTELVLKESAGTFSRYYQQPTANGFYDANSFVFPNSIPFDNRVYYAESAADLTFRPTARLSFDMGGRLEVVRYRAASLYGSTLASAKADVAYRYSRFGVIGAAYEFEHIRFKNVFGASDLHDLSVVYSVRLARTVEFRARVGATRVETLAFSVVPVDPVIAAITGQSSAVRATYRLNYVPSGTLSLSKRLQHGSVSANYERGVTPGNGLFVTSNQEVGAVEYSYSGIRHWGFAASGGYSRLTALVQTAAQYHSYNAGAGVTRELGKGVNVVLRFDERRFDTGGSLYRRDAYRALLGVHWSPGEVPLMLW